MYNSKKCQVNGDRVAWWLVVTGASSHGCTVVESRHGGTERR